ncbi:hypothetical protein GCM10023189_33390 [Nibrella saemangeumensis]|uniref:Tail specific protease domain-containing protein n=1 Tax=Nibrella saemangeumensis TaxID=1084526 RepID=A0ABP8N3Q4_9BACT
MLLVFRAVLAQTPLSLSGTVTDKATGKALPYATIRLAGTSLGTTTNQAGAFVFRIPANPPSQVMVVSYLGYTSVEVTWQTGAQNRLAIALEPISVSLTEVVVRPTDPIPILYRSIEKFSRNYASTPYTAEGFQREYITADRQVIQLLEAAFRTQGLGAAQSTTVLDARYLEDKREKAPFWNPSRGGFYTFGWTTVSGIESPNQRTFLGVDLKNYQDLARYYEFRFRGMNTLDSRDVYVIDFDQKKNVRKALLKGTLYIDAESDAIIRLEQEVSPRGLSFLRPHETWGGLTVSKAPKRVVVQQDRWVTTYRQFGNKWYLNSLVIDTDFSATLAFLGIVQAHKNSLKLHSERIVTRIDTTPGAGREEETNIAAVGSLPTLQNFIKKEYEQYDETKITDWNGLNFIAPDTSFAQLARQLRLRNQQWEEETQKQVAEKRLVGSVYTDRQLSQDVDYLEETLEKVHPGLTWYTTKDSLARGFSLIRSKLARTNSEADFLWLLSPLIEQIHCGHIGLYPSLTTQEYLAQQANVFPVDIWINGDSAVVLREYQGIARGSTILSINDRNMAEITSRISANIPSDGYNQSYKAYRMQHEFPVLFARHIQTADTFEVKVRDMVSRQVRTIRLAGQPLTRKQTNDEYATASVIDSLRTLVLTIPSFSTRQDFPAFLEKTFRTIADEHIGTLIIDLRNNQGGRDDYGALLYTYLADEPFRYYNRISVGSTDPAVLSRLSFDNVPLPKALPDYLSAISKKDGMYTYTAHPNLAIQQPQQNRFKGQVYVLINGGTFSSAAEFAAIARTHQRAVFIGQETGGGYYGNSSLATPFLTLPNSKVRLAIPLGKYEMAVSQDVPVGHGVIPDYLITYYTADILLNQDKEIEQCIKLILKGKK